MRARGFTLIGLLAFVSLGDAHDDVQKRIEALTQSLERTEHKPDQAKLLWQRAQQHQIHRDWALAFRDYRAARQSSPAVAAQNIEPQLTPESRDSLERAARAYRKRLERKPQDYRSRRSLAEVQTHLGQTKLAAEDYAVILKRANITRTEDVLAWAVASTATEGQATAAAKKKLEEHLTRLLARELPSSGESWLLVQALELMAEIQSASGEKTLAKKSLEEAQRRLVRFKPTDPESQANKLRAAARIHRSLHPNPPKTPADSTPDANKR